MDGFQAPRTHAGQYEPGACHGSRGARLSQCRTIFFRVRVEGGQIFDIYYDRAMKNVDDRKGQWFIYRELAEDR